MRLNFRHIPGFERAPGERAEWGGSGEGIQALGEREAELNICLAKKPEVNIQLLLPLPRRLPEPASSRSHGNWLGRPLEKERRSQVLYVVPTLGSQLGRPGLGEESTEGKNKSRVLMNTWH